MSLRPGGPHIRSAGDATPPLMPFCLTFTSCHPDSAASLAYLSYPSSLCSLLLLHGAGDSAVNGCAASRGDARRAGMHRARLHARGVPSAVTPPTLLNRRNHVPATSHAISHPVSRHLPCPVALPLTVDSLTLCLPSPLPYPVHRCAFKITPQLHRVLWRSPSQ